MSEARADLHGGSEGIPLSQDSSTDTEEQLHQDSESTPEASADAVSYPNSLIGRVASPPQQESTAEKYYFWVRRDQLVEETQVVRTSSEIQGQKFQFYGVIEEVRRRSRKSDIREEYDLADGDVGYHPPFQEEGVTYASVNILCSDPPVLTPPIERSGVHLGDEKDAELAYGFGAMDRPMAIGRLRNGGRSFAGLGKLDLDYLLGKNGAHINVTGMSGVGTKTSFLLTVLKCLLHTAQPRSGKGTSLHIVPIILNVKGVDLMWIDKPNKAFEHKKHKEDWEALGIPPEPFAGATFYAPTEPGSPGAPTIDGCGAEAYSWSLSDVLQEDLFLYLFADDDLSPAMTALIYDLLDWLTELDGKTLSAERPETWEALVQWMKAQSSSDAERVLYMHQASTFKAVYRRLWEALHAGENVFTRRERKGNPLSVVRSSTSPPQVIDINALPASLQRFVVAAVVKQVIEARTGRHSVRDLRYLLMIDELNRFAPRGSKDPITRLIERVASELRSRGVILLGAQQLASEVSNKVIENASVRVVGRTGAAEMQGSHWQGWNRAIRHKAGQLGPHEKLVLQPTFRQPMLLQMPFPAWAMSREDIAPPPLEDLPDI